MNKVLLITTFKTLSAMNIFGEILRDMSKAVDNFGEGKRHQEFLIKNSDTCKELTYKYNNSLDKGKPLMDKNAFQKELIRIVSDPNEEKAIIAKIKRDEESREIFRQRNRDMRKLGYKYEEEIFELFDTRRELDYGQILEGIRKIYKLEIKGNIDQDEMLEKCCRADELFSIWVENYLIQRCEWNTGHFKVGYVLEFETFSIDENDMTREKWLKQKGKSLVDHTDGCYKRYIACR